MLESKLEKLKSDNLLIINDLQKDHFELNKIKISLNHVKKISFYMKKNIKFKKRNKGIEKKVYNISIKINLQNNNDLSITSGSFSTKPRINFNKDNKSNILSNFSINTKNKNITVNRQMNKLLSESNFLRKEL